MKKISMKSLFIKQILFGLVLTILNIQCTEDVTPVLYSEEDIGATPVILSMEPTQGLAGVTEIKIIGENFSAEAVNNIVNFGSIPAKIIRASTNELIVLAPDLVGDSINVKISVLGAEKFSDPVLYKLDAAVAELYPFQAFQEASAITTDEFGNIYFSLVEDNAGKGIKKLTPDGEILDYAPIGGGETFFWSLKYKTGGTLYGVRGLHAIFEITEGNPAAIFVVFSRANKMSDLDFDKDQNIWTAGKGGKIFRVTPDKDIKSFDFEDDVSAIRIFDDYLYLAAKSDGNQNIVRIPIISADSLGEAEVYFQFSSNVEAGKEVESFTFAADGSMYIATSLIATTEDPMDPIMFVNTDGSFGTWYPNLIGSYSSSITWGPGINAFIVRDKYVKTVGEEDVTVFTQTILKLNMERLGAPEFGRD